jgi:hypothetical protein
MATNDPGDRRPPSAEPAQISTEENQSQRDSEAPADAAGAIGRGAAAGRPLNTSTSSGLRQDDEEAGELRKKQYDKGATIVSETD